MRSLIAGLLSVLFFAVPGAAFASAGYIHDLSGKATITNAAGNTVPAVIGTIIAAGSTVRTEAKSSAVLKFEDGQVAALSENTQFRVTEYNYNKTNIARSSAAFNLLQGGLRFITGVIGATNKDAVRLNAGTATIGIRGTDLVLLRDAVTQAVTAAVNNGAITFAFGAALGIGISPGQATVANLGETPVVTAIANLAATQFGVVATLNTRPNIPVNTPVVVAASARAAAAAALAATAPPAQRAALQAEADKLLADAIAAAQQALTQAIQAGAVPPTPGATPEQIQQQQQQLQQQLQQEQQGTQGTTSTPIGGGSGDTASPN